jgi:hypothetical protein
MTSIEEVESHLSLGSYALREGWCGPGVASQHPALRRDSFLRGDADFVESAGLARMPELSQRATLLREGDGYLGDPDARDGREYARSIGRRLFEGAGSDTARWFGELLVLHYDDRGRQLTEPGEGLFPDEVSALPALGRAARQHNIGGLSVTRWSVGKIDEAIMEACRNSPDMLGTGRELLAAGQSLGGQPVGAGRDYVAAVVGRLLPGRPGDAVEWAERAAHGGYDRANVEMTRPEDIDKRLERAFDAAHLGEVGRDHHSP